MSKSTLSSSIADLRKSYERAELSEDASLADPLQQFDQWLHEAVNAQVNEPNAMTVATVSSDLRPSTRIVLIKGYDAQGIVWYTNYDSRKGRQLAGNPYAALQFHWVELERVVRIEGIVERVSDEESDQYFHSRPLHWRLGQPTKSGDCRPQRVGDKCSQVRRAVSAQTPSAAALGRLPPEARSVGVLAGPKKPPARPAALPA